MNRMGKEEVVYRIRREGKLMTYGGIVLCVFGGLMDYMIINSGIHGFGGWIYYFLLNIVAGAILILLGGKNIANPEKSVHVRKNPYIFEQAEKLFSNIIYQDRNVIISDTVIANKKNILQMAYLKDINSIYKSSVHSNQLVLENKDRKNTINVYIYPKRHAEREKVLQLLSAYCPSARFANNIEEVPPLTQIENKNYHEPYEKNNSMYK